MLVVLRIASVSPTRIASLMSRMVIRLRLEALDAVFPTPIVVSITATEAWKLADEEKMSLAVLLMVSVLLRTDRPAGRVVTVKALNEGEERVRSDDCLATL